MWQVFCLPICLYQNMKKSTIWVSFCGGQRSLDKPEIPVDLHKITNERLLMQPQTFAFGGGTDRLFCNNDRSMSQVRIPVVLKHGYLGSG